MWTIAAAGGIPRKLTSGQITGTIPSWSRDGSTVYFTGARADERVEIWRVPSGGGEPEQVTRNGGAVAFESADGRVLYYLSTGGVHVKSLPNGEEKLLVADPVAERGFAVFADGIYYLHSQGAACCEIRYYHFSNGETRTIASVEGPLHLGFTVSPDRRRFLFSKIISSGSDLMMVENFR